MSSSLVDRLKAERHRRFVGRARELNFFKSAIAAAELPFYVLHVFGPGGVGKTTLLIECARICEQAQILGLLLVWGKRLFDRLPTPVGLVRMLPTVSALFVALIGLGITTQALVQIGLVRL